MAIYTRIRASDLDKILAPYQIEVLDFTPIEGGNTNSNYHIRAESGEYMLSIMEEKSLREVQELGTLLQWLGEHHFATSPVQDTISGEIVTQYMEKPVLIKKWIHGTVYENFSADQLRQIGKVMAQLHQIPAPAYLAQLPPYGNQALSAVMGKQEYSKYEYWLKERLLFLKKHIPDNLPRGLIHGDVFFDNVLFDNNEIKAIIDFEEARHYSFIFDLGMGAIGLCRSNKKVNLAKVRELVRGYEEIRTLEIKEKESLQLFIQYAAIVTSWWRFWKYNIDSPSPDLRTKYLEMVQIAKHVELLAKEQFLQLVFE